MIDPRLQLDTFQIIVNDVIVYAFFNGSYNVRKNSKGMETSIEGLNK